MREIGGLSDIRDAFDAVLIDQFGVLHNGQRPFSGARDCLEQLAAAEVPVVALSNSGKRAALNVARLARLGFPERLFQAVVTSGELAHARLSGEDLTGTRVAIISRDGDASMIEGLPARQVAPQDHPDLLIIAATEPETRTLDSYLEEIAPLARSGVPAICINPDRKIYANGVTGFGPGLLAERYADLGGKVEMLGKPGREMFQAGLKALGDPPPARCLMIGDSPEHDIEGARRAGCLTALIASGVQSDTGHAAADFRMARLTW